MLQRTVSTSLNNLFALPEFEPLYDKFALFNYIRVRTEDELLKLRLIGIEFNGDSIEEINVTFSDQIESIDGSLSDAQSIYQQMASVATSFPSTARQAKQGESAKNEIMDMYVNGLNAAKTMLSNNDNNEVTITNSGLIAKRMDDAGCYGNKQLRITGNGMYMTEDAWQTVSMAVGEIEFNNEQKYGVIAEVICGNLIAGSKMAIGNEKGTVEITGNGITIYDNSINKNKMFYADNNGNLHLTGVISAKSGEIGGWTITDNALLKEDSNGLIRLDSVAKSIISTSGDEKAVLTSGYLGFEKDNNKYATYRIARWNDGDNNTTNDIYGVTLRSEFSSKFVSFGNISSASQINYVTNFMINYGLNPFGYTEDVISFGSSRLVGKTIIDANLYLNGALYYNNGTYLNDMTGGGLYCSSQFDTEGMLCVGHISYGNNMLNVTGNSYLKGSLTVTNGIDGTITNATNAVNATNATNSTNATYANYMTNNTFQTSSSADLKFVSAFGTKINFSLDGAYFAPQANNSVDISLGSTERRWDCVWLKKNPNVESDENVKEQITPISEKYEQLFELIEPKTYKLKNVSEKDNHDRIHIGAISQQVERSIEEVGLTNEEVAFFCKDKKIRFYEEEIIDENGVIQTVEKYEELDGYNYSLRYAEWIMMNTHMIQKTRKELSSALQEIEELKQQIRGLKGEN